MKTLSSYMEGQANALKLANAFLWFFDLRRDSSNVSRYVRDRRDHTLLSNTYTGKAITFEPPMVDSGGTQQTFKISIDNTDRVETGYIELGKYFDQEIIARIASTGSLSTAGDTIAFRGTILSFNANEATVTFNCGTYNLRDVTVPNDVLYAKTCRFVFKGFRCAYAGAESTCDHSVGTCENTMNNKARFGGANNMSIQRA